MASGDLVRGAGLNTEVFSTLLTSSLPMTTLPNIPGTVETTQNQIVQNTGFAENVAVIAPIKQGKHELIKIMNIIFVHFCIKAEHVLP